MCYICQGVAFRATKRGIVGRTGIPDALITSTEQVAMLHFELGATTASTVTVARALVDLRRAFFDDSHGSGILHRGRLPVPLQTSHFIGCVHAGSSRQFTS